MYLEAVPTVESTTDVAIMQAKMTSLEVGTNLETYRLGYVEDPIFKNGTGNHLK